MSESEKQASLVQHGHDTLKRIFDEELFPNFDIETTEETGVNKVLKAHTFVLAIGSPFFNGMLTTNMKERISNAMKVTEDFVVMKEVLRYIYTREVQNLDVIANELVFAAEKYLLGQLKKICIDSIVNTLDLSNVLQALIASDRLTNAEKLQEKCVAMIAE